MGTVKRICGADYSTRDQTAVDAASAGKTFSTASTVSLIAGAALAGAGIPTCSSSNVGGGDTRVGLAPGGVTLAGSF